VHVWPIGLDYPLPTFGVPLMEGDADVPLDLQACFQEVYDVGDFDFDPCLLQAAIRAAFGRSSRVGGTASEALTLMPPACRRFTFVD
jgi:hypothetical protein